MTNTQVIALLEKMIEQLNKRLDELEALENDPGGDLNELGDRLDEIFAQQAVLITRRHHLRKRLEVRKLAKRLGENVKDVSDARKNALENALKDVSKSIADAQTFSAAISLAMKIASAAGKAASRTTIT